MTVKYQVERRPIGPTGKIYRGAQTGDYVAVPTHPTKLGNGTGSLGQSSYLYPPGVKVPDPGQSTNSHMQEINGEPWIVHSTHFSVDSATESAAPLASAIGSENVRIVQVLSHKTFFKLN